MSSLLSGVDKDTIKLVRRWRSDAIFRYLHAQALPLIQPLAEKMLNEGIFTLKPGDLTPEAAERMLQDAPTAPGQQFFTEILPDEDDDDTLQFTHEPTSFTYTHLKLLAPSP
jgi:hypothetical protein